MNGEENYWTRAARRRMTRRQALKAAALAGLGVAGAGVVGCGSSAQATPTAGKAAATTAAGATTVATKAAGTPAATKPTGKVTIALGDEPLTFDPHVSAAGVDHPALNNVFDMASPACGGNLLTVDRQGKLVGHLAEKWEVSSDGLKIDFWLRKGVKFHDGSTMTAADVKFSLERLMKPEVNPSQVYFKDVAGMDIVDDYHVVLRLKKIDVTILPAGKGLIAVVPKAYVEKVGDKEFANKPIGTGPYKLVERKIKESFTLEAFDDYWGGAPSIKTAQFLIVPEETARVARLKTGEVDLSPVPPPMVDDITATKGLKIMPYQTNYGISLMINANKPPFNDKRVRQAMLYAIDRDAIIKDVLYGWGTAHGGLLPGQFGYTPDLKPYPYDPQKAKQLLAEAGYANGFDTQLDGLTGGRIAMSKEVCEACGSYLTKVGIRTKINLWEYNAWISRVSKAKEGVQTFSYMMGDIQGAAGFEATRWLSYYYTSDALYGFWANPDVDKLVAEAFQTVDDKQRETKFQQIMKILYDGVPRAWLYADKVAFGIKENLEYNAILGSWQAVVHPQFMRWK